MIAGRVTRLPFSRAAAVRWLTLGLAGLGALLVLVATWQGIGTSPDSAAYIGAARNLAAGNGLTLPYGSVSPVPLTQFPPLYPLLLALPGLLGIDALAAARGLHLLLMAANIGLAAGLVRLACGSRIAMPVVAALLVLVSPGLLDLHRMAWSEPLFLLLGFGGLLALTAFVVSQREAHLGIAGALLSLAALTRLAGVAFLATACLALLIFSSAPFGRRLLRSLAFGLAAGAPLAVWVLTSLLGSGSISNRSLGFRPFGPDSLRQSLDTVSGWMLLPESLPGLVKLAALAAFGTLIAILFWRLRQQKDGPPGRQPLVGILLLFLLVYPLFLLFSLTFFDANLPLDNRILSPLYLAVLVLTLVLIQAAWQPETRLALAGLIAAFALVSALSSVSLAVDGARAGVGFLSPAWDDPRLTAAIQALPEDRLIYTNAPEALYLQTGRGAITLPRKLNRMSGAANPAYDQELDAILRQVETGRAAIVHYNRIASRNLPALDELQAELPAGLQSTTGTLLLGGQP